MQVSNELIFTIDKQEVYRYLGIPKQLFQSSVNPEMDSLFERGVEMARDLIVPVAIWDRFDISYLQKSVLKFDKYSFNTCIFYRRFHHASQVILSVVSIGGRLEEHVTQCFNNNEYPLAVMLDAIGSASVEDLAGGVEEMIRNKASEEGLFTSNRLSPGFADWDIREQEIIFKALDPSVIGVRLNPSFTMIPRKSISLAILIDAQPFKPRDNTCNECDKAGCKYRKD